MHPLETCLATLRQIHDTGSGVAEASYYGALEHLLNQAGDSLNPKVRAVPQLRDTGGSPDFGLFAASQFQADLEGELLPGQKPERGVVEVKGWRDEVLTLAASEQVARYGQHYGMVLASNYRDFVLVGRDAAGQLVPLERMPLAASEAEFLELLRQPRQAAARFGDRLLDFLARALSYNAPLTDPQDLAWFLASHAREARARVDNASDLPGLVLLREGLERALGLKFEGETGERFFRATWAELEARNGGLTRNAARFDARKTRDKLLVTEHFDPERLRRYAVRAFDNRWCYYLPARPLWNEPRPRYWEQCWEGNAFFMIRFRSSASPEGVPCYWVTELSDDHFIVPDNACFPVWLRRLPQTIQKNGSNGVLAGMSEEVVTANLSSLARAYLQHLKLPDPDQDAETAELLWRHALAIGFSPAYLRENADGIRQDWPRIPLPEDREKLLASADLGREIAALLDVDRPVTGVTAGKIRPELRTLGAMFRVSGGSLDPDAGELAMTVGWGHPGQGGVTMPGKGRIEPHPVEGAATEPAYDLYLNEVAYWANVPRSVWEYSIGGYQVIKKWLSYREKTVLGRDLRLEEAVYLTDLVRRLTALVALQPALDASYAAARDRIWNTTVVRPT